MAAQQVTSVKNLAIRGGELPSSLYIWKSSFLEAFNVTSMLNEIYNSFIKAEPVDRIKGKEVDGLLIRINQSLVTEAPLRTG